MVSKAILAAAGLGDVRSLILCGNTPIQIYEWERIADRQYILSLLPRYVVKDLAQKWAAKVLPIWQKTYPNYLLTNPEVAFRAARESYDKLAAHAAIACGYAMLADFNEVAHVPKAAALALGEGGCIGKEDVIKALSVCP